VLIDGFLNENMKIIGMIPVYNDEDIIEEVIEHLLSQGLELVVLDNGSTDATYEKCRKFVGKGILKLHQFKTEFYQWDLILRMLYDMALVQKPDWVIRSDSDEFLESGEKGVTLKDAIIRADAEGYNLIQFDRFDFFMTDNDNESARSIKEKMPYYSYQGNWVYRAWKYFPGIRIGDAEGHYPIFPLASGYKIYAKKFVLRHYTFRSKEQAEKKMKQRIRHRGNTSKGQLPLDLHEQKILAQDFSTTYDHKLITKYEDDGNWNYEIVLYPFGNPNPPKKEDIFTDTGELKQKLKTVNEYKRLLEQKELTTTIALLYKKARSIKKSLFNRTK